MTLDPLHTALITGFVATVTGLSVHALTRWRMAKNYISIDVCTAHRRECLLADIGAMRQDLKAIQEDIAEIQRIQKQRTVDLVANWKQMERILRVIFEQLEINADRANELLSVNHFGAGGGIA